MSWELSLQLLCGIFIGIAVGAWLHKAWDQHSWWRHIARARRQSIHIDERSKRVLP